MSIQGDLRYFFPESRISFICLKYCESDLAEVLELKRLQVFSSLEYFHIFGTNSLVKLS